MATWPTTLPAPLYSGYGLDPLDQTIRTDMEAGNKRTRRRTSARNDMLALNWRFTDAEMNIFRTWFDDATEADGGSAWFNTRLMIGTGGSVNVEARFASALKATLQPGPIWDVQAQVEVR